MRGPITNSSENEGLGWTAGMQAGVQLGALGVTLAIAIIGGIITGETWTMDNMITSDYLTMHIHKKQIRNMLLCAW